MISDKSTLSNVAVEMEKSKFRSKMEVIHIRFHSSVTRTSDTLQISLCPVEHGDGFDTSHRDSWSPGVKYIASASVVTSIFKSEFVITFTDFRDNNISRIRRSSQFE